MSDWIRVKDSYPLMGEKVILLCSLKEDFFDIHRKCDYQNDIFVGMVDDVENVKCVLGDGWTPFDKEDITHWMPLPELPK